MTFVPTNLCCPGIYPFEDHPEYITLKRRDMENCIRATIEETMKEGGCIVELSRDCMLALDSCAQAGNQSEILSLQTELKNTRSLLLAIEKENTRLRAMLEG
jgi:hypothetical protein